MKKTIQSITRSTACLLACTLLFSLIFATLYYFNLISTNTFHVGNWIAGVLAFAIGGFIFGRSIVKKALLHALLPLFFLTGIAVILCDHTLLGYVEVASKALAYVCSCIFAFQNTAQS